MNTTKTNKLQIIEKYCLVMNEFIKRIHESKIILKSQQSVMTLSVGITSIHRVFEYTLLHTKQLDKALYQARQTYYYFLEYIEQIQESQLISSLNHKDAITFVYKKAIFSLHDGIDRERSSTLTNILSLEDDSIVINDKEWRMLFIRISKFINSLLCWNNYIYDFKFRIHLCQTFLDKYLLHIERLDFTTYYLEYIHQKLSMSSEKYVELLDSMLHKSEKSKRIRSGSITEQEKNDIVFSKVSIGNTNFKDKFNTCSTDEFVNWLYSE